MNKNKGINKAESGNKHETNNKPEAKEIYETMKFSENYFFENIYQPISELNLGENRPPSTQLFAHIDHLEKLLEIEGSKIENWDSIVLQFKLSNKEKQMFGHTLIQLRDLICPFFTAHLRHVLNKNKKNLAMLESKKALVMIAITGDGKSTLVNYMRGLEMKKEKNSAGLFGIYPVNKDDADVCRVASTSKSETSNIQLVIIKDSDWIIVDTPGSDDTRGALIDIAKAIGIFQILVKAKNIKPVIIINYQAFKLKNLNGVKNLINAIHNIFKGFKNMTYLINKLESKDDEKVFGNLMAELEGKDEVETKFLDDIKRKSLEKKLNGLFFVYPTDEKGKAIFKAITNNEFQIKDPEKEIVQPSYEDKLMQKISKAGDNYVKKTRNLFNACEFSLMADVISNYKYLNETINDEVFKQKYITFEESENAKICSKLKEMENRFLTYDGNFRSVNEEDIRKLKENIRFSKEIQPLRAIGWKIPNTLENVLEDKRKDVIKSVNKYQWDEEGFSKEPLKELQLFEEILPSGDNLYIKKIDEYKKNIDILSQSITQDENKMSLDDIHKKFLKFQLACSLFTEIIEKQFLESRSANIKASIKSKFDNIKIENQHILKQIKLDVGSKGHNVRNFDKLRINLNEVDKAKHLPKILDIVGETNLQNIKAATITQAKELLKKLLDDLNKLNSTDAQNKYPVLSDLFNFVRSNLSIFMDENLDRLYQDTTLKFTNIEEIKISIITEIKGIFHQIQIGKYDTGEEKIYKIAASLRIIKKLKGTTNSDTDVEIVDAFQEIEKLLISNLKILHNRTFVELNAKNFAHLDMIKRISDFVVGCELVEADLPGIKDVRTRLKNNISDCVMKELEEITKSIEKLRVNTHKTEDKFKFFEGANTFFSPDSEKNERYVQQCKDFKLNEVADRAYRISGLLHEKEFERNRELNILKGQAIHNFERMEMANLQDMNLLKEICKFLRNLNLIRTNEEPRKQAKKELTDFLKNVYMKEEKNIENATPKILLNISKHIEFLRNFDQVLSELSCDFKFGNLLRKIKDHDSKVYTEIDAELEKGNIAEILKKFQEIQDLRQKKSLNEFFQKKFQFMRENITEEINYLFSGHEKLTEHKQLKLLFKIHEKAIFACLEQDTVKIIKDILKKSKGSFSENTNYLIASVNIEFENKNYKLYFEKTGNILNIFYDWEKKGYMRKLMADLISKIKTNFKQLSQKFEDKLKNLIKSKDYSTLESIKQALNEGKNANSIEERKILLEIFDSEINKFCDKESKEKNSFEILEDNKKMASLMDNDSKRTMLVQKVDQAYIKMEENYDKKAEEFLNTTAKRDKTKNFQELAQDKKMEKRIYDSLFNKWKTIKVKLTDLSSNKFHTDKIFKILKAEVMPICEIIKELGGDMATDFNNFFAVLDRQIKNIIVFFDEKDSPEIVKVSLANILDLASNLENFRNEIGQVRPLNFASHLDNINKSVTGFLDILKKKESTFNEAIVNFQMEVILDYLSFLKTWEKVFEIFEDLMMDTNLTTSNFGFSTLFTYEVGLDRLKTFIKHIIASLDLKNIEQSLKLLDNQKRRDVFYEQLKTHTETLKKIESHEDKLKVHLDLQLLLKLKDVENNISNLLNEFWDTYFGNTCEILRIPYKNIKDTQFKEIVNFYDQMKSYSTFFDQQPLFENKIKIIRDKIFKSFDSQFSKAFEDLKVATIGPYFIEFKKFEKITFLKDEIKQKIDEELNIIQKKDPNFISQLSVHFNSKEGGIEGSLLMEEQFVLKIEYMRIWFEKIKKQDYEYILNCLNKKEPEESSFIDESSLKKAHDNYFNIFKSLLEITTRNMQSNKVGTNPLKELTDSISATYKKNIRKTFEWPQAYKDKIPELLAKIACVWSINSSKYVIHSSSSIDIQYLMKPHPGQLAAIFRMTGIGYSTQLKDGLDNNLTEIGIGEGKSLILAMVSIIFALYGYKVNCACFSDYFSKCDESSFRKLYKDLGISDRIVYGTFNQLCENIINEAISVRTKISEIFLESENPTNINLENLTDCKILLIDEVDVFFSREFYGESYYISTAIKHETISKLFWVIWGRRNEHNLNFLKIKSTPEYMTIEAKFPAWTHVVAEAVKDIIADIKDYSYIHEVIDDKIAVRENGTLIFNRVNGYKTAFVHFQEYERKKISKSSLENSLFLILRSGVFSYVEIALVFKKIIGVSGTLKGICNEQDKVIKEKFNIKLRTYIPSVYGKNKRTFKEIVDVITYDDSDNYVTLFQNIKRNLEDRPVLVFFESEKSINDFFEHKTAISFKTNETNILKDDTDDDKKELMIKFATKRGQLTLCTKAFGKRDFICRDDYVLKNKGIHVIQTFFSELKTEEIQIQGCTARQGQEGSYCLIMKVQELDKFLSSGEVESKVSELKKRDLLYKELSKIRDERFDKILSSITESEKSRKEEHAISMKFREAIIKEDKGEIIKYLKAFNIGQAEEISSRTLCLIDGTESMGPLIQSLKDNLINMFIKTSEILQENNCKAGSFELQIAVYRDYDCGIEGILQVSPWKNDPKDLVQFMSGVKAFGGDDWEEAVEIGLRYANIENYNGKIDQIILIGDAAAKPIEAITEDRKKYSDGEAKWLASKYGAITDYKKECKLLKEKSIPVNSFYLEEDDDLIKNFKEISSLTNGKCKKLELSGDELTSMMSQNILNSIGGSDLAQKYLKKYGGHSYL